MMFIHEAIQEGHVQLTECLVLTTARTESVLTELFAVPLSLSLVSSLLYQEPQEPLLVNQHQKLE